MFINNKGFSLIEILVTVGLISILTTIAVPAYKNYRLNTFKTVLKTDSSTSFKMYQTFHSLNGDYCGSFETVGLKSLLTSDNYRTDNYFLGFETSSCTNFSGGSGLSVKKNGSNITATNCTLHEEGFSFGVASAFSAALLVGYSVQQDNASPVEASSSYCSDGSGGVASSGGCLSKADCENVSNNCHHSGTGAGSWVQGTSIAALCP